MGRREPRFALLGRMRRIELAVHRQMAERILAAGYSGFSIPHVSFMAHMTVEGRRLSEFAGLMQVTLSAASQLATTLERWGLVERVPDPTDRRAVLVRATRKADAGFRAARQRLAEIEDDWEKAIGVGGLERLDRTLQRMILSLERPDPPSAPGSRKVSVRSKTSGPSGATRAVRNLPASARSARGVSRDGRER
jgi:DNA-binding MarR family transcriptional regulator